VADDAAELCALFAAVLKLEYVAPDTDFFAAGGHSLTALALAISVEGAFGVRIGARDVLECATPQLLGARLARLGATSPEPSRKERPETALWPGQPLAPTMQWLWLERQRDGIATGAYTVPCLLAGGGPLDIARMRSAVDRLAVSHPVLNSVFFEVQGMPRVGVSQRPITLEVVDLQTWEGTESEFRALVYDRVEAPFDLSAGPLLRPTLILRGGGAWWLLLVADHLICDGMSLQILAADIVRAYSGQAPVAGDAERWPQQDPVARTAALEHWRARLSPPPAALPLPARGPRVESAVARTEVVTREISPLTMDRLRERADANHAVPFAPLAAAVARALGGITGSEDICVGTAVDRRVALGLSRVVGSYVSTVPLRLRVPADVTVRDLVGHVAARTLDALDNSEITFAELVAALNPDRVPGRTPFFDVWVALYPYIEAAPEGPDGIALHGGPIPLRQGIFELSFQFVEHSAGLRMVLQYDISRYARDAIERMAQRVASDLDWIAAGLHSSREHRAPEIKRELFKGFQFGPGSASLVLECGERQEDLGCLTARLKRLCASAPPKVRSAFSTLSVRPWPALPYGER